MKRKVLPLLGIALVAALLVSGCTEPATGDLVGGECPPADGCDYYIESLSLEQTKRDCFDSIAYWAYQDLNNIYGNYCYDTTNPSSMTYCKNYVSKLKSKISANIQNCNAGIPASELTFSVYP